MAVSAITPIAAHSQDTMRQQSGLHQDMWNLQRALSSGSLATAQRALSQFQQDLQSIRPAQNGIRASADVNPKGTMRNDLEALQRALDSGDLAMAQEAFVRVQQDQSIGSTVGTGKVASQAASALPKQDEDAKGLGLDNNAAEKTKGNLIDVVG